MIRAFMSLSSPRPLTVATRSIAPSCSISETLSHVHHTSAICVAFDAVDRRAAHLAGPARRRDALEEPEVCSPTDEMRGDEAAFGEQHERLDLEIRERAAQAQGALPELIARDELACGPRPFAAEHLGEVRHDDLPRSHDPTLEPLAPGSMMGR